MINLQVIIFITLLILTAVASFIRGRIRQRRIDSSSVQESIDILDGIIRKANKLNRKEVKTHARNI